MFETLAGHSITRMSDGSIYLFGGNNTKDTSNNFYKYNIDEKKWEVIREQKTGPTKRAFHSAVACNNFLFIFGGKSNGYKNDLHWFRTGKIIQFFYSFERRAKMVRICGNGDDTAKRSLCACCVFHQHVHVCHGWI